MLQSSVTTPGLMVEIDGLEVQGLLSATITSTNSFSADSYSLAFAIGAPPLRDIYYWSALSPNGVDVFAGNGSNLPQTSLITGTIDTVYIDATRGIASIDGRDLSSSLVDSYRQGDFVNQTASEVVVTIAGRHGLRAIAAPTSGNIGRYFGEGYTRLSTGLFSRLRSDWDLVVELARENDFDVFVKGRSLFFQPAVKIPLTIVSVTPDDLTNLRLERSLTVSPDAVIRVQSWNCQDMSPYTSGAAGATGATAATSLGRQGQPYLFSASNLTAAQVTQSAARYATEINRLQNTLLLEMPWNLDLSPRTGLMLTRTKSPLDGLYRIENVQRHYSSTSGSRQSVRAVPVTSSS